jgi:translation initiation factor IF-3
MNVILIGEDGRKVGNMSIEIAEQKAKEFNKSIIMVAKNVYRMVDAGKLKYEQRKRQKKQRSHRRTHKVKEVKIGPSIDKHDLDIKLKHIKEFLGKGLKTKITMQFRARQIVLKDIGLEKMNFIINSLLNSDLAVVDKMSEFDGRNLTAFLIPTKK